MNEKKRYKIAKWCNGCGDCVEACSLNAIVPQGDRYMIADDCDGCEDCLDACAIEAIIEDKERFGFRIEENTER